MTPEDEQSRQAAPTDSAVLLGASGILAYAASMVTHEALGHGIFCLAVGDHNAMLTAWGERCDARGAPATGIEAAGPDVQFIVSYSPGLCCTGYPKAQLDCAISFGCTWF